MALVPHNNRASDDINLIDLLTGSLLHLYNSKSDPKKWLRPKVNPL